MKLKTGEVLLLYDSLTNFGELLGDNVPIKLGFKIIRDMKQLEPIYQSFEEARLAAIRKYAENDELPDDKIDIVNQEIKELLGEEIDVTLVPIKLDDLESLSINIKTLSGLYPIIENNEAQVN